MDEKLSEFREWLSAYAENDDEYWSYRALQAVLVEFDERFGA